MDQKAQLVFRYLVLSGVGIVAEEGLDALVSFRKSIHSILKLTQKEVIGSQGGRY